MPGTETEGRGTWQRPPEARGRFRRDTRLDDYVLRAIQLEAWTIHPVSVIIEISRQKTLIRRRRRRALSPPANRVIPGAASSSSSLPPHPPAPSLRAPPSLPRGRPRPLREAGHGLIRPRANCLRPVFALRPATASTRPWGWREPQSRPRPPGHGHVSRAADETAGGKSGSGGRPRDRCRGKRPRRPSSSGLVPRAACRGGGRRRGRGRGGGEGGQGPPTQMPRRSSPPSTRPRRIP